MNYAYFFAFLFRKVNFAIAIKEPGDSFWSLIYNILYGSIPTLSDIVNQV